MHQTRFEICFVTAGRMDFGLISPILKEMTTRYKDIFSPKIIAMGAHASEFHGGHATVIDAQDFEIHELLETLHPTDDAHGIAKSFANTADKISTVFKENSFDLLIIPGDRYEMLACASIATIMNIPIAHLYGGDITYGAYDDSMNLIYATIRATKEACEEQLQRFNPPVPGHHYPFKVLPLVIGAYNAHQPALNLDDSL